MLEPHEELVRDVLLRVAGPLIEAGRAKLDVTPAGGSSPPGRHGKYDPGSPAGFMLTPANPAASPLWVGVDIPGEAYVCVGHRGTQLEIGSKGELEAFERHLEEIARAVIGGEYEEWVNRGRSLQAVGYFRNTGFRVHHNVLLFPRWWRRFFRHVRYEPY